MHSFLDYSIIIVQPGILLLAWCRFLIDYDFNIVVYGIKAFSNVIKKEQA